MAWPAPAVFLGLVQLAELGVNADELSGSVFGSMANKALTVHCLWRVMALICLVAGHRRLRREAMAAAQPPPLARLAGSLSPDA